MTDEAIGIITTDTEPGTRFLIEPDELAGGDPYWLELAANDGASLQFVDETGTPEPPIHLDSWNANTASRVSEVRLPGGESVAPPSDSGAAEGDEPSAPVEMAGDGDCVATAESVGGPAEGMEGADTDDPPGPPASPSSSVVEIIKRAAKQSEWYEKCKVEADELESDVREARAAVKEARAAVMATAQELRVALGDCPDMPLFDKSPTPEPETPEPDDPAPAPEPVEPDGPGDEAGEAIPDVQDTPLRQIPGLPGGSAKRMAEQGIRTVRDLSDRYQAAKGAEQPWYQGIAFVGPDRAASIISAVKTFLSK